MVPKVVKDFIRNLEINQFLDDHVVCCPIAEPRSELITNEHPLELSPYDNARPDTISGWAGNEQELPQQGLVMFHVEVAKGTIMVPVKWEYSLPKLFAEFISVSYLTWDLTSMTAWQATKEFHRRLKVLIITIKYL